MHPNETIKINLLPNKTEILLGLCLSNTNNNFTYNIRTSFREIEIGENDVNLDIIEKKKEEVFYQKHLIIYEEKEENENETNNNNVTNQNQNPNQTNQLEVSATHKNVNSVQFNKTFTKKKIIEIIQVPTKEYHTISKESINKNPKFFNLSSILISGEMVDREDLSVNIPKLQTGTIPEDIIEDYHEDIDFYVEYLFKNQKFKPEKTKRRSARRRKTNNSILNADTNWKKYENEFGIFITPNDNYTKNIKGNGIFYPKNTDLKYFGNFINSQIEGNGLICREINDEIVIIYKGHFSNGMKSGKGIIYITEFEYYEGEFSEDTLNGYGIYHYANGDLFDVFFK